MPSIGGAMVASSWLSQSKMGTDPLEDGQPSAYREWSLGLATHTEFFNRCDTRIGGLHWMQRDTLLWEGK